VNVSTQQGITPLGRAEDKTLSGSGQPLSVKAAFTA
jgi:hypothetical protein